MSKELSLKEQYEAAVAQEEERTYKIALKTLVLKKKATNKDYIDAVEALGKPREEWTEMEATAFIIRIADKSKTYAELLELTEAELEDTLANA